MPNPEIPQEYRMMDMGNGRFKEGKKAKGRIRIDRQL
jgi:hypothetical protein